MPQRTKRQQRKAASRATTRAQIDIAALYEPLNAHHREVRLLTIIPSEFADDIRCTLAKASLDEGPFYEALSYVWGSPQYTRQIYLDEAPYNVTSNLESALRHLRYVDRPRVLWVDALCINQRDLLERNSQVRHMTGIYERASEVIAWLGDESGDSSLAFDAFEALPNVDGIHWDVKIHPMVKRISLYEGYVIAVRKLLQRSWWHRVWTVQESIIGRSLRFYCGHRQISANTLLAVSQSYFTHFRSCCYDHHMKLRRPDLHRVMESLRRLRFSREYRNSHQFQDLIAIYRHRRCTDPRDKIYGLLGLASGQDVNLIAPDYSIPTPRVYEQVTIKLIRKSRSLEIFSQLYPRHLKPTGIEAIKLPSWVPDWTSQGSDDQAIDLQIRLERTRDYMASCGSFPSIKCIRQGKIGLRAILFGSFAVLSVPQDSDPYFDDNIFHEWESLARTTTQFDQPYADSASTTYYDAYWQTLCCSITPSREGLVGKIDRTSDHSIHRSWYEAWWDTYKSKIYPDERLDYIDSAFTAFELSQLSASIRVSTKMRKLFISKDQGWLGLAPMDAELGDRIALLEGGSVPYILRPKRGKETEYELIGDAYVHGIMDGQAWNGDDLVSINLV